MSESTGESSRVPLPPDLSVAQRPSSSDKPVDPRTMQAPETRDPSAVISDEILAEKGQKNVADAIAHAKEGNMGEALSALRVGQSEPPSGLAELSELAAAAAERGDSKPLKLDSETCVSIAQSFVGQDKKDVKKMLAEINLSAATRKAILDNIPEGPSNNPDVSQGEQEIRQAQIDALSEQAKQSAAQQIAALNAQIGEEESNGKPDSMRVRFLKQQRENVKHRMKNIEHWLKASPSEWSGRVGSFVYWTIVALFMIVIMEMAAINKMAGKK